MMSEPTDCVPLPVGSKNNRPVGGGWSAESRTEVGKDKMSCIENLDPLVGKMSTSQSTGRSTDLP